MKLFGKCLATSQTASGKKREAGEKTRKSFGYLANSHSQSSCQPLLLPPTFDQSGRLAVSFQLSALVWLRLASLKPEADLLLTLPPPNPWEKVTMFHLCHCYVGSALIRCSNGKLSSLCGAGDCGSREQCASITNNRNTEC